MADMGGKQQFRLGDAAEHWLRPWPLQLAVMLAVSLVTRWTMLGDPNYHYDETLFFLIGQRMHDGLLPYVDLWDRKGPGLFALYYLFAGISDSVLSYQVAALAFAALTAFLIARIAQLYTGRLGAVLAGVLYLVMLPRFLGGGGQAGVFFNLPIVLAAWLVLARPPGARPNAAAYGAMALAGIAATFKQTCLFDGVFLGLLLLWTHHKAGATLGQLASAALRYALLGALPMALFFAAYALAGHFAELWHAMVWSNLDKQYNPRGDIGTRIVAILTILTPALMLFILGLALPSQHQGRKTPRLVLAGWLAANVAALIAIPNFIDHYMLPVIVVLSLIAAPVIQREPWGLLLGLLSIATLLAWGPQFDWQTRQESRRAIAQVTQEIRDSGPAPRLFIFQGPVALYSTTGLPAPSPLLFPIHLSQLPERDVSHIPTTPEVRRILATRPTVIMVEHRRASLINAETRDMVMAHVRANCRLLGTRNLPNRFGERLYDLYVDCR